MGKAELVATVPGAELGAAMAAASVPGQRAGFPTD